MNGYGWTEEENKKSDELWAKARELGNEYTKAQSIHRRTMLRSEEYLALQAKAKHLQIDLLEVKRQMRTFSTSKYTPELKELKAKSQQAWKESQEYNNSVWERVEQTKKTSSVNGGVQ